MALATFGRLTRWQFFSASLIGQRSTVATVISTLGIAAHFTLLRHRVQAFIDRRFYRKKYDAEKAVAHFATTARDKVELDKLTTVLLDAVKETV